MAQGQQKVKRTQPPHKKSQPSRHDRRGHLAKPNPERRKTARAQIPLVGTWAEAVGELAQALDRRMAFRLAIIVAGRLLVPQVTIHHSCRGWTSRFCSFMSLGCDRDTST